MKKKKKQSSIDAAPKVNPELEGFEIRINSFGEIVSNYDVEKINDFLNKHVDDKKLRHLNDEEKEEGEKE